MSSAFVSNVMISKKTRKHNAMGEESGKVKSFSQIVHKKASLTSQMLGRNALLYSR